MAKRVDTTKMSPPTVRPSSQRGKVSRKTPLPSFLTTSRLKPMGLGIVPVWLALALQRHYRVIPGDWDLGDLVRLRHSAVSLEQDVLLDDGDLAGANIRVDHTLLTQDQGVVGRDLALELPVQHDGPAGRREH